MRRGTAEWAARLVAKVGCGGGASGGASGVFLFHTRKAAGTTLREYLERVLSGGPGKGRRAGAPRGGGKELLYESEGLALDPRFLSLSLTRGVVTVTTLRHPLARAKSLYWYKDAQSDTIKAQGGKDDDLLVRMMELNV